jgi:hypothetical protein
MLYVSRDKRKPQQHDLGSVLCLRVLDLLPPGTVAVHECRSGERRAPWLVGTPTLALEGGTVLRGFQALEHLQRLAVQLAEGRGGKKVAPSKRASSTVAPPPPPRGGESLPPSLPEEGEDMSSGLWETAVAEDENEDEHFPRKLTQDDLARMQRSVTERPAATQHATAPEPMVD